MGDVPAPTEMAIKSMGDRVSAVFPKSPFGIKRSVAFADRRLGCSVSPRMRLYIWNNIPLAAYFLISAESIFSHLIESEVPIHRLSHGSSPRCHFLMDLRDLRLMARGRFAESRH